MNWPDLTCVLAIIAFYIAYYLIVILIEWVMYKRFVARNSGKEIFVYEGRKDVGDYIKDNILPLLDPEIEVALKVRKRYIVYSNLRSCIINLALREIKKEIKGKGFPVAMKVFNGRMLCRSLNVELYRTIQKDEEPGQFITRINEAFDELRVIAERNQSRSRDK